MKKSISLGLLAGVLFASSTTLVEASIVTPAATIIASSIVCNNEANLPNWGLGGHGPITSTTATIFVENSDGACHFASGWNFQWGDGLTTNPGDSFVGDASGFSTFGATDVNGVTSTIIPLSNELTEIRLRESLKDGYSPFTLDVLGDNSNNVTAEFYCANDVENYDNFDFISNPQAGATYNWFCYIECDTVIGRSCLWI